MKKIISLLLIASLFGCTKEEDPTLRGEWTLVKIYAGNGYVINEVDVDRSNTVIVNFQNDGALKVSGEPITSLTIYDRYEIKDDHTVRFISTIDNYQMDASYSFEDGLMLWELQARCGYGERFVRSSAKTRSGINQSR